MIKNLNRYWILVVTLFLASCSKDGLWNTEGTLSDSQYGNIVGQLINDEDNTPLKGVKVLFERQTKSSGANTFVDTVSTDVDGKFSYKVPYSNKVRVVLRDTGRYVADTVVVDVLENKEYSINMKSHPRFGTSKIIVDVENELGNSFEGIKVGLYVRNNSTESYSEVETLISNSNGKVEFANIAFPVYYKVKIAEREIAYQLDSLQGKLETKNPLQLKLKSRSKFGIGDLTLKAKYFYTNEIAKNTSINIAYKSILDDQFVNSVATFDTEGKLVLPKMVYPAELKLTSGNGILFPFTAQTIEISEELAVKPIEIDLMDATPRYSNITPSAIMNENTLVAFYGGVSVQEMEFDSKGNIYAVTTDNQLIRIKHDGSSHKVLAKGLTSSWGLALVDDYTMFVIENTDGHRVKKVTINPVIDSATVSVYAGSTTTGTADGIGDVAKFNRPSDAVYDPSRNCIWLVEWAGQRIRKIDLETGAVSTLATGTGYGFGISLTKDFKYLYIASHTSPAGIVKYDIDNKKMYTVRTGYSIRHIAAAPNGDVYFNINGGYQGKLYKLKNETLIEGNTTNTTTGFETIASNGSYGPIPAVGYSGTPNRTIATANVDGSPNGIAYDAYRGRLYFSVSGDKILYYLRNNNVPTN